MDVVIKNFSFWTLGYCNIYTVRVVLLTRSMMKNMAAQKNEAGSERTSSG